MIVSMKYEFGMMVWYGFGNCMGMGSSLGKPKLDTLFASFGFGMKVEG